MGWLSVELNIIPIRVGLIHGIAGIQMFEFNSILLRLLFSAKNALKSPKLLFYCERFQSEWQKIEFFVRNKGLSFDSDDIIPVAQFYEIFKIENRISGENGGKLKS